MRPPQVLNFLFRFLHRPMHSNARPICQDNRSISCRVFVTLLRGNCTAHLQNKSRHTNVSATRSGCAPSTAMAAAPFELCSSRSSPLSPRHLLLPAIHLTFSLAPKVVTFQTPQVSTLCSSTLVRCYLAAGNACAIALATVGYTIAAAAPW